jgi:hypothetical protein
LEKRWGSVETGIKTRTEAEIYRSRRQCEISGVGAWLKKRRQLTIDVISKQGKVTQNSELVVEQQSSAVKTSICEFLYFYDMSRLSLVLIVLLCACQRIAVAPISPLVGNWSPESVVCDGVPEPGWSDVVFEFKQLAKECGSFQLNDTPNDTLWQSNGNWKILSENQIERNDGLNLTYAVNANKLQVAFYVPLKSKQRPCTPTPNNPCITIAYGSFVFNFSKEN